MNYKKLNLHRIGLKPQNAWSKNKIKSSFGGRANFFLIDVLLT